MMGGFKRQLRYFSDMEDQRNRAAMVLGIMKGKLSPTRTPADS
jgi:hypothetical protein